ncbi:MAG: hypothetical protein IIV97_04405 [Oscillospiraceae bacterium]|nr:hypothetical protein [Oscillospiraceae bacterium]
MKIELSTKQFRRLLDLVYIGNWVLNSTRGGDRIPDFDEVESLIFSQCLRCGMGSLVQLSEEGIIPSNAFAEGGIHEAIMDYEDAVFFDILAEELAHRDIAEGDAVESELALRRESYIREFEQNGISNINVDAII